MSLFLRARPLVTLRRLPLWPRSLHSASALRVSDYGRSGGSISGDQSSKPDGAVIPQYNGPSIAEKKKGKGVTAQGNNDSWEQPTTDKLANKGEEMSDNMYKKDVEGDFGLSSDNAKAALLGKRQNKNVAKKGTKSTLSKGLDRADAAPTRSLRTQAALQKPVDSGRVPPSPLEDTSHVMQSEVGSSSDSGPSSFTYSSGDVEDLKDDALRMKQKAENTMDKAKLSMEEAGVDIKEKGQEVWNKTKKGARKLKESMSEVIKDATTPVYARTDDGMYPTSDAKNARGGVQVPMHSPDSAAGASGASMGEDVNSLRKSMFDGPQDMPQGVGKRAVNEKGEEMETGAKGS